MKFVKRCLALTDIPERGCFRTLEMTEILEKDSGLPVVTTVPANMWHCLRIWGLKIRSTDLAN